MNKKLESKLAQDVEKGTFLFEVLQQSFIELMKQAGEVKKAG